ncbi:hypothetical protein B0T26DRAFT_458234 [Lasiosphaeria miniovina]|uniref:Uncharacterized protein n=1 Tax=Lasiosphaeria miniovina TaxID=1954250 RepID=A0AA39ZZG6_9PEZI|nr:uncharacterized protein B0T26DRAFT_458234 [Lasiosphaeria miniovina]KAK0706517.1 hypothetical protein B0T26DRAFT_458234 [Lasiosphaeria miniovina]
MRTVEGFPLNVRVLPRTGLASSSTGPPLVGNVGTRSTSICPQRTVARPFRKLATTAYKLYTGLMIHGQRIVTRKGKGGLVGRDLSPATPEKGRGQPSGKVPASFRMTARPCSSGAAMPPRDAIGDKLLLAMDCLVRSSAKGRYERTLCYDGQAMSNKNVGTFGSRASSAAGPLLEQIPSSPEDDPRAGTKLCDLEDRSVFSSMVFQPSRL